MLLSCVYAEWRTTWPQASLLSHKYVAHILLIRFLCINLQIHPCICKFMHIKRISNICATYSWDSNEACGHVVLHSAYTHDNNSGSVDERYFGFHSVWLFIRVWSILDTYVVCIILTRHICIDILNNYKCIPQKSGAVAISSSILQNCLCAFNNLQSHPYTIEYSAALWWNCICVTRIYVRLESTIYMNSHTEWTTNLPQHLVAAHLRDAFVIKKKFMHLGRISKIYTTHVWNWICD